VEAGGGQTRSEGTLAVGWAGGHPDKLKGLHYKIFEVHLSPLRQPRT
jgi:hypothetical protein